MPSTPSSLRAVGVEEELMLVHPDTGRLAALSHQAVQHDDEGAEVEQELFLQQIETSTPPCTGAEELLDGLRAGRRAVGTAAAAAGVRAVAVPVPVLEESSEDITPQARYRRIRAEFGEMARQALVCAMHIHVDVADDAEGVRVVDGIRPWLPVLVALSANSPFWQGRDTGHASWRSQVWSRWPSAGPAEPFGDVATYRAVSQQLVDWGASLDPAMLYFDIRLAESYPTVEIRVADVTTDLEDTVLVALLSRALVSTVAAGTGVPTWRADLLRAAGWRAARSGTAGRLVHPRSGGLVPARTAIEELLGHVRPALEESGDVDLVAGSVERLLARGTGATRQRAALERTGDLGQVVADLARRTEDSWS